MPLQRRNRLMLILLPLCVVLATLPVVPQSQGPPPLSSSSELQLDDDWEDGTTRTTRSYWEQRNQYSHGDDDSLRRLLRDSRRWKKLELLRPSASESTAASMILSRSSLKFVAHIERTASSSHTTSASTRIMPSVLKAVVKVSQESFPLDPFSEVLSYHFARYLEGGGDDERRKVQGDTTGGGSRLRVGVPPTVLTCVPVEMLRRAIIPANAPSTATTIEIAVADRLIHFARRSRFNRKDDDPTSYHMSQDCVPASVQLFLSGIIPVAAIDDHADVEATSPPPPPRNRPVVNDAAGTTTMTRLRRTVTCGNELIIQHQRAVAASFIPTASTAAFHHIHRPPVTATGTSAPFQDCSLRTADASSRRHLTAYLSQRSVLGVFDFLIGNSDRTVNKNVFLQRWPLFNDDTRQGGAAAVAAKTRSRLVPLDQGLAFSPGSCTRTVSYPMPTTSGMPDGRELDVLRVCVAYHRARIPQSVLFPSLNPQQPHGTTFLKKSTSSSIAASPLLRALPANVLNVLRRKHLVGKGVDKVLVSRELVRLMGSDVLYFPDGFANTLPDEKKKKDDAIGTTSGGGAGTAAEDVQPPRHPRNTSLLPKLSLPPPLDSIDSIVDDVMMRASWLADALQPQPTGGTN